MNSNKTVAVAMSGGVDSSVAALLLKEQGYDVIGITAVMLKNQDVSQKAKEVCDSLGIKHYSVDLSEEFNQDVIKYFEQSYKDGNTPNPCVVCNKKIKWGKLLQYSINELGADYYATGHYAKIVKENNSYKIKHAKDEKKDQLYMLFELTQKELSITLFPLGDLKKEEVREIAAKHNIPSKNSKDSQDICFIAPPDSTKKYLLRKFKEQKGDFIDIESGEKVGTHDGFYQYTIGQRKGIGIAAEHPLYVIKTDSTKNIVYVGKKEHLLSDKLYLTNINWQQDEFVQKEFDAMVKIRYNSKAQKARIMPKETNIQIQFEKPVSGITPGQAAVIYNIENSFLIGGGWIKK